MRSTALFVTTLIATAGLLGCASNGAPAKSSRQQAALITPGLVVEKTMPVDIRVIGSVEAYTAIRVKAQVSGQLMKVQFRQGDDVKAGAPLFLIDPSPFDAAIRQAEASIAKDTALLRQAEANLRRDTAQETYARDQAARYQKLFSEGVMSKQQTEQYDSDANMRAEAVRADQAAIESAQASLKADAASLESAKISRAYCDIRSPVDGRTGDLNIEEGNLVRSSDAELVTINQVHPIYVTFSVPENRLPEIRKYMAAGPLSVVASPPGDVNQTETGQLTFIDNTVDSTTGTIKLKATFANGNSRLWPGQFVNVALRLKTLQNALVVPVRAIQMGQDGEFAYVVKDGQSAEMRPVTTGLRIGEEVVVEKGLEKGETIVIEGQGRLAPGMKVRSKGGRGQ
jgi:membrane fusion protein, multidrug efflux system